jgi:hypothetical protein
MNELSGRVIGCAFTVLNTRGRVSWKWYMRMRGT